MVNFQGHIHQKSVKIVWKEITKNVKLDAYLFQANNSTLPTANAAIATISKIKLNYNKVLITVNNLFYSNLTKKYY